MDFENVDQLLQACSEELTAGSGYGQAERLIHYVADHPEQAPTVRRLGQSARAAGNPALAAVLFRAALAGVLAKQKRAAAQKVPTIDASRSGDLGETEIFDTSGVDYVEQRSREIAETRSTFEFAELPPRRPARPVAEAAQVSSLETQPSAQPPTANQAAVADDDTAEEEEPQQATIFEALVEGADFVEPLDDDDSNSDDDPDLLAIWDSERAEPQPGRTEHSAELDWETLASEAYEFDEAPTRDELDALEVEGPVSRHQRAQQEAIRLGLQYGWDEAGVRLLTEIFETYSWSSTKRSLRAALDAGTAPAELQLAHEARLLWRDSPYLALNLSGYEHTYLSWPLALQIVDAFGHLPDIFEIQGLLDTAYDDWRSAPHLQQAYTAFRDYLKARIQSPFSSALCSPAVEFESSVEIDYYESDPVTDAGGETPNRRDLHSYGLLPKHHGDAFLNRVGIIEWHPDVRSWVERFDGD